MFLYELSTNGVKRGVRRLHLLDWSLPEDPIWQSRPWTLVPEGCPEPSVENYFYIENFS